MLLNHLQEHHINSLQLQPEQNIFRTLVDEALALNFLNLKFLFGQKHFLSHKIHLILLLKSINGEAANDIFITILSIKQNNKTNECCDSELRQVEISTNLLCIKSLLTTTMNIPYKICLQ